MRVDVFFRECFHVNVQNMILKMKNCRSGLCSCSYLPDGCKSIYTSFSSKGWRTDCLLVPREMAWLLASCNYTHDWAWPGASIKLDCVTQGAASTAAQPFHRCAHSHLHVHIAQSVELPQPGYHRHTRALQILEMRNPKP